MKRIFTLSILMVWLGACAREIGDDCQFDVDCSPNMDRNCDNSQPDGYCLIIGCGPDECPEEASCVEYTSPCPKGEGYEPDTEPDGGPYSYKCEILESNRGRTYCMRHCKNNDDCRSGYACTKVSDLFAAIIDFEDDREKICAPK